MTTKGKTEWKKPELTTLGSAADAVAHYLESGKLEHAAAIRRLHAEKHDKRNEDDQNVP